MAGLSYLSGEASQETNTTGVMSSILDIVPDDGTALQLAEAVAKGSEAGLPLFFDLRDSNDDPLPDDTEVLLQVERPEDDDDGLAVSEKEPHINPWNTLTLTEQRNEENIDAVKLAMKGVITVRYFDVLHVAINSSAEIDWSNSEVYFYRKGVRRIPMNGGN